MHRDFWLSYLVMYEIIFQATFCGSTMGKKKGYHFSMADFEALGYHFCDTLLDYCDPDNTKVRPRNQHLCFLSIYALSESIINLTFKNSSNNYCSFYQWVLGFKKNKSQQYHNIYLYCLLTQILLWNACLHDVGMKIWGNT